MGRDVLQAAVDKAGGAGRTGQHRDVEAWAGQVLDKKMAGQSHGGKKKTTGGSRSRGRAIADSMSGDAVNGLVQMGEACWRLMYRSRG